MSEQVAYQHQEYSAEVLGRRFVTKTTDNGISFFIDGEVILSDASTEETQKVRGILGLAYHRIALRNKIEEERKKKSVDTAEWQEAENPTEPHTVRLTSERNQTVTRRRKQDDRLFKCLDTEQLQAMKDIDEGYNIISGGVQISKYEPFVPGTGYKGRQGRKADQLRKRYLDWARAASDEGFAHAMAMDVISLCKSFRDTDKARRKGRGTAKANLLKALDAYCFMLGWKQRPA